MNKNVTYKLLNHLYWNIDYVCVCIDNIIVNFNITYRRNFKEFSDKINNDDYSTEANIRYFMQFIENNFVSEITSLLDEIDSIMEESLHQLYSLKGLSKLKDLNKYLELADRDYSCVSTTRNSFIDFVNYFESFGNSKIWELDSSFYHSYDILIYDISNMIYIILTDLISDISNLQYLFDTLVSLKNELEILMQTRFNKYPHSEGGDLN